MRQFVTMFLVMVFVLGMAATASAAANITFNATNVYYDNNNGDLVVEGIYTNAGSHDGTITYSKITVLKGHGDDAVPVVSAGHETSNGAFVPAHGTKNWRYRLSAPPQEDLSVWSVKTHLKYRW